MAWPWKKAFESTKTLLEWLHFDANVSDALTMFDQRAMDLIRAFLNSLTWSIVFNPTITSAKEVRGQTTQLKKRTQRQTRERKSDKRNRNGVKTSGSVVEIPLAENIGTEMVTMDCDCRLQREQHASVECGTPQTADQSHRVLNLVVCRGNVFESSINSVRAV